MKTNINKVVGNPNLIVPLLLILTIIALVNSTQFFFFLFQGDYNFLNYAKLALSKLIYFYYFLLLALLLLRIKVKIQLRKKNLLIWISYHSLLLVVSFLVHQTITIYIDKLLFKENYLQSYYNTLLNNPDAWIDIVAYILLVAGIALLDSKRISQENEIKCVQLEEMLLKSKLQELRTRIQPQFLFKTLSTIKMMIGQNKNREANTILTMLSDFLRTTVYETDKAKIELVDELHFLNIYLGIEKAALERTIVYKENIEPDTQGALVPIFIIQQIIEVLLYELVNEDSSNFELTVDSAVQNFNLSIKLAVKFEKKISLATDSLENMEAVKVLKERFSQLYASAYSFEVSLANENLIEIQIAFPFEDNCAESEITLMMEK